jgi:hypothetical protein
MTRDPFWREHKLEWYSYQNAKTRCTNPNDEAYEDYGKRGILFKFTSFRHFFEVLGPRTTPAPTINRIDNDGHYEEGNVEWATRAEQNINRRNNRKVEVDGITRTVSEWARIKGLKQNTILERLAEGWCNECSIMLPLYERCPHKTTKEN